MSAVTPAPILKKVSPSPGLYFDLPLIPVFPHTKESLSYKGNHDDTLEY